MLISLNWLKQYIDLDEKLTIKDLENALTMIGQEVEKIEIQGENLKKVLTSKIVKLEKHPDSDHLTICQVDNGNEILQVICGASNHKEGDIVAMAQIGAKLEEDFIIKKGKIRGVESNGMLCSEKELKVGDDDSRIIIFPKDTPLGIPLNEYYNLNDVIFELEITPNRPDCLSHIGIARELSAHYNKELKKPLIDVIENEKYNIEIDIKNETSNRYLARVIKNVKVEKSPKWLKDRLESVGIRSINNLVDISNYVMLETNQPSHIFDLNKLKENKIVIDYAKNEDKIITLDEKERNLTEKDIVVKNENKVIAIAGIMGSLDTEVDEDTKDILIEVAHFNNIDVRKSSRYHNLSSESSYRFERRVDIENMINVIERITDLIVDISGGIVCNINDNYAKKTDKLKTEFSLNRMDRFIGYKINKDKVIEIFRNLEIEVEDKGEILYLTAPSHRDDLINQFDYFEEVIRMIKFDNIPNILPKMNINIERSIDKTKNITNLKIKMTELGLREVINYSFIPKNSLDKIYFKQENTIELKNPITEDFVIMRPTLMYSLLKNAKDNYNRSINDIRLFEISKRFEMENLENKNDNFVYIGNKKVLEKETLAIILSGNEDKNLWNPKPTEYTFFDLKGIVEALFSKIGFDRYQLKRSTNISYHPGISADIFVGKELIGTFGKIHPNILENFDIEEMNIIYAEIYIDKIEKYINNKFKYSSPSKYQSVSRDLALVVKEDILVGDMIKSIEKVDKLIQNVELFDIYTGIGIEKGNKSVAINVILRDDNKTLEENEINIVMEKIKNKLFKEFNAILRG